MQNLLLLSLAAASTHSLADLFPCDVTAINRIQGQWARGSQDDIQPTIIFLCDHHSFGTCMSSTVAAAKQLKNVGDIKYYTCISSELTGITRIGTIPLSVDSYPQGHHNSQVIFIPGKKGDMLSTYFPLHQDYMKNALIRFGMFLTGDLDCRDWVKCQYRASSKSQPLPVPTAANKITTSSTGEKSNVRRSSANF